MAVNALIKQLGKAARDAIANRSAPEEVRVLVDVIHESEVEGGDTIPITPAEAKLLCQFYNGDRVDEALLHSLLLRLGEASKQQAILPKEGA